MNENMLPVGTLLRGGTYKIERQISSGGFGNTYVVWNRHFKAKQAMKEFFMKEINLRDGSDVIVSIPGKKAIFESQRDKFMKEAQRLWKLNNPHIVKVHDFFEENGTVYYVMDFIDGQSLSDIVKTNGPLGEKEALSIFCQILDALSVVHGQEEPMLHLDIKPANIMLSKAGTAFLLDFGSSKQIDKDNLCYTSTAFTYTPGYAPSEVIDGNKSRIGPWSDLYELGATLHDVLTGHQPPTVSEILESGEKSFSFPDTISNDTRKLILWLMTPSSASRPKSVEEVLRHIGDSGATGGTKTKEVELETNSSKGLDGSSKGTGSDDDSDTTILGGSATRCKERNDVGDGGETVFGSSNPPTEQKKPEPPTGSNIPWKKIGIIAAAILVLAGIGFSVYKLVSGGNKINAIELEKEFEETSQKDTIETGNNGGGREGPGLISSLTLVPSSINLTEGEAKQLQWQVVPAENKEELTWSTTNPNVATVSAEGVVHAIGAGTATITLLSDKTGIEANATLTVKKKNTGGGDNGGDGNDVNKKNWTLDLGYATYSGDTKNGKMDGIGVLTYKQRHAAGRDLKNGEKVYAEPGEHVNGAWNNGYLSSGTLLRNNGDAIKIKY